MVELIYNTIGVGYTTSKLKESKLRETGIAKDYWPNTYAEHADLAQKQALVCFTWTLLLLCPSFASVTKNKAVLIYA